MPAYRARVFFENYLPNLAAPLLASKPLAKHFVYHVIDLVNGVPLF